MYRFLPILLFAYALAITNEETLAITTEDIYDNSYALIIGIDKYENVSILDYAVKDANSIASLLKDNFNFPAKNIKVLINDKATYSNIRNNLDEISSSAKENDRVLIYFAGHGMTLDLPEGGEMGYLLPVDGKRDKLFVTSIPMDDLKRISSMSQAKHMLFLVDACYGGLAATGSRGLSSTSPNYIEKITKDKSRQIITAGGRGEEVIEKAEWGHSAFTLNLLRGLEDGKGDLNDDGYITADELGLFLKEKVTIDSDSQQTPQSKRFTSQEGEFIFVTNISKLEINNPQITINESNQIDYNILAKEVAKEIKKSKKKYKLNVTLFSNQGVYMWKSKLEYPDMLPSDVMGATEALFGVGFDMMNFGLLLEYANFKYEQSVELGSNQYVTSYVHILRMTHRNKFTIGGGLILSFNSVGGLGGMNNYLDRSHSRRSLDAPFVIGLGSKSGIYAEMQIKGHLLSPSEIGEAYASSEQLKFKVTIKEKTKLVFQINEFDLSTQSNYSFIVGVDGTNPHIGLTSECGGAGTPACWDDTSYLYHPRLLYSGNGYFQISHIFNISKSLTLEVGGTYRDWQHYHFSEYLQAEGLTSISTNSPQHLQTGGLFFGIQYHI